MTETARCADLDGTTIPRRALRIAEDRRLLDVLLGDAQLHGLIPARRLDCLGRLANALGPWPSRRS